MGFEELTAKGQGRDVGLERKKVEGKFQLTRGGCKRGNKRGGRGLHGRFKVKGERGQVEGWVRKFLLEAGAEPQGNENASEEAGQISHQFAESDDEEGSETHRERQVEVLRQLGLTM